MDGAGRAVRGVIVGVNLVCGNVGIALDLLCLQLADVCLSQLVGDGLKKQLVKVRHVLIDVCLCVGVIADGMVGRLEVICWHGKLLRKST